MALSSWNAAVETAVHIPPPDISTVGDVAVCCRNLATSIGASEFALFLIGPARERGKLVPALDSDHPETSVQSTILSSNFGDEFVKRAANSTMPSWWSGERESLTTRSLATLSNCSQTPLGLPDLPGIALPVFTESGLAGLVTFFGTEIELTDRAVLLLHHQCFGMFESFLKLSGHPDKARPAITQRELECLKLTANGYTSEEIAIVVGLSVHTTNQYLTKLTTKLNAVSRMHAVAKALRLGLID